MIYIFYIFLGYLLYRFIAGFLIPVFKTSRQIRRQFNEMQEHMEEQMNRQQQDEPKSPSSTNHQVGEYIDFEDVKSK